MSRLIRSYYISRDSVKWCIIPRDGIYVAKRCCNLSNRKRTKPQDIQHYLHYHLGSAAGVIHKIFIMKMFAVSTAVKYLKTLTKVVFSRNLCTLDKQLRGFIRQCLSL